MTTEASDVYDDLDRLRVEAIDLLTRAAALRLPRVVHPPDPDSSLAKFGNIYARDGWTDEGGPIDWAEWIVGVLLSTAANRGGVEALLAGRSGSWEVQRVRELLESAGGDDVIAEHRTAPVIVSLNIPKVMDDAGRYERYVPSPEEPEQLLRDEAQRLGVPVENMTRNGEPAITRWVAFFSPEQQFEDQRDQLEIDADHAYGRLQFEVAARLGRAVDDKAVLEAVDREFEPIRQQLDADLKRLTEQWTRRFECYSAAFEAAVRVKAASLGLKATIEFRVDTDPEAAYWGADSTGHDDDALAFQLWEHAHNVVPLALLMASGEGNPL